MWASYFVRNRNKLSISSSLTTEVQVCQNVGRPKPRPPNLVFFLIFYQLLVELQFYVITATAVINFSTTALEPQLRFLKIPKTKQEPQPRFSEYSQPIHHQFGVTGLMSVDYMVGSFWKGGGLQIGNQKIPADFIQQLTLPQAFEFGNIYVLL